MSERSVDSGAESVDRKVRLSAEALVDDLPDVAAIQWPRSAASLDGQTAESLRRLFDALLHTRRNWAGAVHEGVFGTSAQGLAADGHPWLSGNRLDWFERWDDIARTTLPPGIGPISDESFISEETLLAEFSCELATVVGEDLPTATMRDRAAAGDLPYNVIDWWSLNDGESPNVLRRLSFYVEVRRPESVPVIRFVEVTGGSSGSQARRQRVLVNGMSRSHELDPAQERPPLIFVFHEPQRAVVLQYGILGEPGTPSTLHLHEVRLVARDENYRLLEGLSSQGSTSSVTNPLQFNHVPQFIGVRDPRGRIRRIELHFGVKPPNPQFPEGETFHVPDPQIVYRIWHEPLPPAAVRLGEVGRESQTVTLPFHCDRAVAFVRGFKLSLDEPRPINGLQLFLNLEQVSDVPRRFEIRGSGGLLSYATPGESAEAVRVYYSLLAWDSRQTQLYTAAGSLAPLPEGEVSSLRSGLRAEVLQSQSNFMVSHFHDLRSIVYPPELPQPDPRAVFAAVEGIDFRFAHRQELGNLALIADHPQLRGPPPFGNDQLIRWAVGTHFEGGNETVAGSLWGRVLVGPDLQAAYPFEREVALALPVPSAPRTTERWNLIGPSVPVPPGMVQGTVGFPALSVMAFEVDDEVRELDVEIGATDYNGRAVKWVAGGDISISEPGSSENGEGVFGLPCFCAVRRHHVYRLESETLVVFERATRGTTTYAPDRYAEIHNRGNRVIAIVGAFLIGDDAALFQPRFVVAEETRSAGSAFASATPPRSPLGMAHLGFQGSQNPVLLQPGKKLVVGGSFTAPDDQDRAVLLGIQTNDPSAPLVTISLEGRVIASQADGGISGNPNFWNTRIGGLHRQRYVLQSFGYTPLLVRQIRVEDSANYTVEWSGPPPHFPLQIEPGEAIIFVIRFSPTSAGSLPSRIVAETNVGDRTFDIVGIGFV